MTKLSKHPSLKSTRRAYRRYPKYVFVLRKGQFVKMLLITVKTTSYLLAEVK